MFDHLLDEKQRRARADARDFVKATPRQLILDMDQDKVRFPKYWLREGARRNLLGVHHPVAAGGRALPRRSLGAVTIRYGGAALASLNVQIVVG